MTISSNAKSSIITRYGSKLSRILISALLIGLVVLPARESFAQRKMVRVLIATPAVEHDSFRAIADVMAGSLHRDFKRAGGMELIERGSGMKALADAGQSGMIDSRERAVLVGKALKADIVIFGTIVKSFDFFLYSIVLFETEREVIQRTMKGELRVSSSPQEIGRRMKVISDVLFKFVPMPSELEDYASNIREVTVNPEQLPTATEIGIPERSMHGVLEQVMSYYRVFPGEEDFRHFQKQEKITRFIAREDLDDELTQVLNRFHMYGDFAIRHNLQAYLVKDCSVRTINVLLANNVPVFYMDGVLIGYQGMSNAGGCIFKTHDARYLESADLSFRKRVAIFIMLPKPGKRGGIARGSLDYLVSVFHNEAGNAPTLIEIKESMFDIISSGLDG